MLKIIIIDDEPQSLEVISSIILRLVPNAIILGAYTDPFEGLKAIQKENPDVLLLDIVMPGLTGLELLKRLPSIDFEVIFATAYNHFAINAIKLSAVDYLLKPVDPPELVVALNKAEKKIMQKRSSQQFEVLEALLDKNTNQQEHKIALPTFDGISYIKMNKIIRIKAGQNYSTFHFREGNTLLISKNIGVYEGSLDEYDFMRVHRSHIVNLHCVGRFIRLDGGYLIMEDQSRVAVSNAKKEELLLRLKEL